MKQKIMAIAAAITASFAMNVTQAQTAMNHNNSIVNSKVLAKFQKAFPDAENTSWAAVKTGYEARFSYDGIETVAGYNKAGRSDYIVERYNGDKLPSDIQDRISNVYPEYDIVNATEVQSEGITAYLVNIESKKFSKVIRISDNEMDVYKDVPISTK
jgi:hypothetical protein